MFLGPFLKVHVVHKTHKGPELLVLPMAQVISHPAHDRLHGKGMADMERFGIIGFQGLQGFFPGDIGVKRAHGDLPFCVWFYSIFYGRGKPLLYIS